MDPIVNAREPRGEEGRRFLEHMNTDHEEMARWSTSFLMIGRDYDVLDVGCGGGRNVQYFLERCDKGTVTGIDMSEMSVKVSKEVNSKEIEKGRCRILQGNVTALPFDGLSFDIVTAFETVYYWPSIVDSFKGILNVLRRGGAQREDAKLGGSHRSRHEGVQRRTARGFPRGGGIRGHRGT